MKYLLVISLLMFVGCGKGDQGAPGLTGQAGLTGLTGEAGKSVVMGPAIDASAQCASGSGQLLTFFQDQDNSDHYKTGDSLLSSALLCNGSNGLNGSNGSNGVDLTPISKVQFCTSTTVYPTTFSEVGFCIGGKLWGVYSTNGGFLTDVADGTWSSDGINSSCSFTVSGCTVTH